MKVMADLRSWRMAIASLGGVSEDEGKGKVGMVANEEIVKKHIEIFPIESK